MTFDIQSATDNYINALGPEALAKAAAYTSGSHWITVLAKQANIDPDRIFIYDGSRQSNRFTANVAGIGSSARIAISDVALNSASLDEVKAVTAHEIGHYVSGHVWHLIGTATKQTNIHSKP